MEPEYLQYYKNEIRALASLSLIDIAAFLCPEGFVLPLEKPDAFALYYVFTGKGCYTLGDSQYPAGERDLFAVYPNTVIKCEADSEEPWALYSVTFEGTEARLLLNAAGFQPKEPMRHLKEPVADDFVKIMKAFYHFRDRSLYGSIQSTTTLYLLFSLLIKTAPWNFADMPSGWTGTVHFQKAVNFIHDNFNRTIGINDIADHVSLSSSRLYKLFRQHVFMSPQQYLMEIRVREGLVLLAKRFGSVKEIALAVGLEDPLYFSKLVKKKTGKSPTEYMRQMD